MDDAVTALVERHVRADGHIVRKVFLQLPVQRAPSAKVAPTEVGRKDENLVGLLQNSIIDRNVRAGGEQAVDVLLLSRRVVDRQQRLEHFGNLGLPEAERVDDGVDVPHKDARIPQVILPAYVLLGSFHIRFLLERIDAENLLVHRRSGAEVGLDVAVARFGASGLHAERQNGIVA